MMIPTSLRAMAATVLLASAPVAFAEAPVHDSQPVLDLNREMLQRLIVDRDVGFFRDNAHERFLVVAPGGVVEDREQAAHGAQSFDAKAVGITDERVSLAGDTAVGVGKLEIDGTMQPVGRLGPLRFMAVYVYEDGRWRLLGRALTPCLPIAIERGKC